MESSASTSVTVIIPVFNAFREAARCLKSVLLHRDTEHILIIDDASTEGVFSEYLAPDIQPSEFLSIVRSDRNRGFVASCNEAMRRSAPADVVLLNSDTVVTKGWISKLRSAAFSHARIATVTPFTNNGTVCSIPAYFEENQIPSHLSVDQFGALVEEVSQRDYSTLPTCVGFCVYIKRSVLELVGLFDEVAFGKGYGEENDFSLRAQALGYRDILDDATFVYHEGSKSFSAEKVALQAEHSKVIAARYPTYFANVQKFRQANPLKGAHERIHLALLRSLVEVHPQSVLHVLHNGPTRAIRHTIGGTEHVVAKQIRLMPEYSHFSLVCAEGAYQLTAHIGAFEKTWRFAVSKRTLHTLCAPELFSIVHVHHTHGFDALALIDAVRVHPRVVVSAHDHSVVCPRFFLLTPELTRCGLFECHKSCGFDAAYVDQYRSAHGELLKRAKAVVHFSDFTKEAFEIVYGPLTNLRDIPHVTDWSIDKPIEVESPAQHSALRVAFVGTLAPHKGLSLANQLSACATLPSGKAVKWKSFGGVHGVPQTGPMVIEATGAYKSFEQLRGLLAEFRPHVVLFPSLCPETFGLTIEETQLLGIPAIVGPEGGPAERIQARQSGWVVREMTLENCLSVLGQIGDGGVEWNSARRNACALGESSRVSEGERGWAQQYSSMYASVAASHRSSATDLLAVLNDSSLLARDGLRRGVRRALSRAVNEGVLCLDRLGLRTRVERLARALLPTRSIERLRTLRS